MAGVDPAVRDKILQDPQVQDAMKKAGQDALSDPEVQAQILKVAQEKFPEAASAAKDKIMEWANDPEVQKQAYAYAGIAADYAWQSVSQVGSLIEQGPTGVRVLAFIGGVAAMVQSIWVLLGLLSPVSASAQLPKYVVHFYQAFFASTTMLFEAKPEWIQQVPGLDGYQNLLIDKAKFLAEAIGRGLFYGFQGTLWLCFASFTAPVEGAIGLWFMLMAMLHILMGFDVMPQEVAKKMYEVRQMVAMSLPSKDASRTDKAAPDEEQPAAKTGQEPLLEPSATAAGSQASRGEATPATQSKPASKGGCCIVQ